MTDRGTQFTSEEWKNSGKDLGVQIVWITLDNPQSNPVERAMKDIRQIIRVYANKKHTWWERIVPRMERVINPTHHSGTNFRLYELQCKPDDRLKLPTWIDHSNDQSHTDSSSCHTENIEIACQDLIKQADKRYRVIKKKGTITENCQAGDSVLLRQRFLSNKDKKFNKKFALIYDGSFRITQSKARNVYELISEEGKIKGSYNYQQLKRYKDPVGITEGTYMKTAYTDENLLLNQMVQTEVDKDRSYTIFSRQNQETGEANPFFVTLYKASIENKVKSH